MVKRILYLIIILTCFQSSSLVAQDSYKVKKWDIYGYLKDLQSFTVIPQFEETSSLNFIHNRINFRWYPSSQWSIGIEQRTRLFFGEQVKMTPDFAEGLKGDDGLVDLSFVIFDTKASALHTITDRLWVNWANNKWDIRLGRQRINWGVNLVWNPNDIFNASNYLEFDYEERPGSDAIRIQYFPNWKSAIELTSSPGKSVHESTFAGMYRFNKWTYDFQFFGAWWEQYLATGLGWAGNIGNAGFKGEASYFHPNEDVKGTKGIWSASITADYSFKKPVYIQGSFLFNSQGSDKPVSLFQLQEFTSVDASTLSPSKHNLFFQANWMPGPLINLNFAGIYSPGTNILFLLPSFSYSMAENWDLLFYAQLTLMETDSFSNQLDTFVLRFKWSF